MALAVAILWSLAAVGAGSAALSAVGLRHALPTEERPVWAFAIGLGVLGWITFFLALAGLLTPVPLLALSLLCASGLALLRGSAMRWSWPHLGPAAWLGLGALALVILFDAVEALVPPFNIDALAYHIALPKRFAEINGIDTVARLRVGAPPGLLHMTYIIPLVLGGEGALKLCLALLGWAPGLLIYVLARRYLSFPWALAATLIFLTVPAVIFAGGTAQVEPTAALFVLAGAFAVAESLRTRSIGFKIGRAHV